MINIMSIIFITTSIFGTYTIFKFMTIFFERSNTNRSAEKISYITYFLIGSIIYFSINNPQINLGANIIMFFLLTLNYPGSLKLRIASTILIYVILAIVETMVYITVDFFNFNIIFNNNDLQLIVTLISSKIISYIIVLALSNFKMIKNSNNVSLVNWFAIIIIPISTLFMTIMIIFESGILSNKVDFPFISISIAIMFIINIFVFYLYDSIMKTYNEKMEKELLIQQNSAYRKQVNIISNSQENMRMLRHDIKNHIFSLQKLIEKFDREGSLSYLNNIYNSIEYSNEYARSGNAEVDSILNYKIDEAINNGITVNLKLNIPVNLNIEPFDLSVILGNLLDNSIYAAYKSKSKKEMNITIEFERNIIYINISNSFDGVLSYKNNKLITTQSNKKNHGLGLNSVKKSIDKYDGTIDIHHTDKMFYVDALIYNPAPQVLTETNYMKSREI